jgi:ribosome assembly protein 4
MFLLTWLVKSITCIAWTMELIRYARSLFVGTIQVWDIRTRKLKQDLPGHADEVYAVDWSPDGEKVASGGKDRVLKLWMN